MIRKWITMNILLTDLSLCQCTKLVIFVAGNRKFFTLFTRMRCYLGGKAGWLKVGLGGDSIRVVRRSQERRHQVCILSRALSGLCLFFKYLKAIWPWGTSSVELRLMEFFMALKLRGGWARLSVTLRGQLFQVFKYQEKENWKHHQNCIGVQSCPLTISNHE